MIIANPLYDTAFKELIRDPEVAKAIIGTLLETEVLDVELYITERNKPMADGDQFPRSLRLDYCATILNENGEKQQILIEIQKSTGAENILRFREYLALAGYKPKTEEKGPLPIVTVYFLGFKLENVPTPCLKVSRQYIDMLENKVLETKEKFVELLTHDSYIIQSPRIKTVEPPRTKLEKILSVFEQKDFAGDSEATINYKYPIGDDYHKKMLDILHYIGTDPEERKKLDNEAYWLRYEDCNSGELLRAKEALAESQKNLVEAQQRNRDTARELKQDGMPLEKIARLTGLTAEEILNLN